MSEPRVSPTPCSIEPARCPKCGEPMKLTRIEPGEPGHDLRMYACKCGHSETRDVAYK